MLWRIGHAQAHSDVVRKRFADAGGDLEAGDQSSEQVARFYDQWKDELKQMVDSFDRAPEQALAGRMLQEKSAGLWAYMLDKTEMLASSCRPGTGERFQQQIVERFQRSWTTPVFGGAGPAAATAAGPSAAASAAGPPAAASAAGGRPLLRSADETKADVAEDKDLPAQDPALAGVLRRKASPREEPLCSQGAGAAMVAHWQDAATVMDPCALELVNQKAENAAQSMRTFIAWQEEEVTRPCVDWLNENLASWAPRSIALFGSHSYGLPLPSSDFDLAVVLGAGRGAKAFLQDLAAQAKVSNQFSRAQLGVMTTCQPKCRGVWVDIKPVRASRSADGACQSSDLMKLLIDDRRSVRGDFHDRLLAVRLFKLICHQLKVVQRHMESRGRRSRRSLSRSGRGQFWIARGTRRAGTTACRSS